jgi:hypothetical protein
MCMLGYGLMRGGCKSDEGFMTMLKLYNSEINNPAASYRVLEVNRKVGVAEG